MFLKSRGQIIHDDSPSGQRVEFLVPALSIRIDGQLELFEEHHFLDFEWKLDELDATLSENEFSSKPVAGAEGEVDVVGGKIEVHYIHELHQQISMLSAESGWSIPALVNWLDRQIRHPDITRTQAVLYIQKVVTELIEIRTLSINELAAMKFPLSDAIASKIDGHRRKKSKESFNLRLFNTQSLEVEVSPEICFKFKEGTYSPNWYYESGYKIPKHFFPFIGELKSEGEEFECADFISHLDIVEYWIRNLERRPDTSFWLQTSTDRFYPDFLAKLKDGRILVVEYKGEHLWDNEDSKEKRAVGELWAERSDGKCLFVMPKGKDWNAIEAVLHSA